MEETVKVKSQLRNLSASLDSLEDALQPLFEQSLPEFLVPLESIQQAKLQTALPYVLYDLVFIYLKLKGIDPRTHAVVPELDRIRQYFEKIANAETKKQERTTVLDKAAAERFIKHAIAQASQPPLPSKDISPPDTSISAAVPVKITSKMMERKEYEARLKEEEEEPEEPLKVFDEQSSESSTKRRRKKSEKSDDQQKTKAKKRKKLVDW